MKFSASDRFTTLKRRKNNILLQKRLNRQSLFTRERERLDLAIPERMKVTEIF